jgi:hypothetical protein
VVRWRLVIDERYRGVGELLKALSFSYIIGRPKHLGQDTPVIKAFKKIPTHARGPVGNLPKGRPIEVWFQNEARLAQKNRRTRIWAKRGARPSLPADQRYENAHPAIALIDDQAVSN